ncbi:S-4TM family putative pore-forming effector [Paracidovorax wautersii]|uniref:Uncharacterized protein n=1 Tax=Paracidovorax wautersii TaxID=1177982 RepID=A0A1I2H4L6_9BURK|nr:S-4TM family putative pore-forming effector [Paracidovorax wautersii]SFF24343.1 hypothetical protein SAMN04489711_11929 [Paracidovorax wautersii]
MSDISTRQSDDTAQQLLKARSVTTGRAKLVQGLMVTVSLGLCLAAIAASIWWEGAKPYVVVAALFVSILDVAMVDRWIKAQVKQDAKLAELFDCSVLQLERNKFLTGKEIRPEEIGTAARKIKKKNLPDPNWYSTPLLSQLPIYEARLVCQRANLVWDRSQRTLYRRILLGVAVGVAVAGGIASLATDPHLVPLVLAIAPLSPFALWALRENNRHLDTTITLDRLEGEVQNILNLAKNQTPVQELTHKSRELQDAIFNHRASSPLVFNWLYKLGRDKNEAEMKDSADYWVQELLAAST